MRTDIHLDDAIGAWLRAEAPRQAPGRVLQTTFERTRRARQEAPWRGVLRRDLMPRFVPAVGAAVLVVAAILALSVDPTVGPGASPTPSASAVPASPSSPRGTRSQCPPSAAGSVLDCSSDGSAVLIQKHGNTLIVIRADGTETQVAEQLTGSRDLVGSGRPVGATISGDGTRVVFAGLTRTTDEAVFCHDGALLGVDARGGPAEVVWTSHIPQNGIIKFPTYSPDGTRIAFEDGYCDWGHTVWVMNADGSDPHQIVSVDSAIGAGWTYGLAWSPAGDRIALQLRKVDFSQYATWSFAADGSDLREDSASASEFCWPGWRC